MNFTEKCTGDMQNMNVMIRISLVGNSYFGCERYCKFGVSGTIDQASIEQPNQDLQETCVGVCVCVCVCVCVYVCMCVCV